MKLPRWFHQLGSPPYVYRLVDKLGPWLGGLGCALLAIGAVWGLAIAPPDYQQGEVYRIIFIHPQTAYVGMMAYVVMAVAAATGYIWRLKVAHAVAVSAPPNGAWFTFCALITGAIWGKPTWGTYWQWGDPRDARRWIEPEIPAPLSSSDYAAGRDPALEAIRKTIQTASGGFRSFQSVGFLDSR